MKKQILIMVAALGLLTACDPSKDSISMPGDSGLTGDQLGSGFTTKQYADETYTTEAADGNYFSYFTSPSRVVTIYQLDDEGERNVLATGKPNGTFKIVPKRGNPSQQTYYVETRDFNGNTITAEKTANVFVPSELAPEMRLLASDSYGSKVWKWDFTDGPCWGNGQYAGNDGADFADNRGNQWWGVSTPEELTGQLGHSDTGVATGEESSNATMVIYDDGNVVCFDAGGNQIRKGKLSVEGWTGTGERYKNPDTGNPWQLATLKTTEGAILFPFKINGSGTKPTEFDILKLTSDQLVLVYGGNGAWGEATYWRFRSESDADGMLTDFGTKAWTWDFADGPCWGNGQYAGNDGADFANNRGNQWWGVSTPEELTGQLGHSDTGVATGEESADAYMTFDYATGKVTSYNGAGSQIRQGNFEISYNMGERLKNADTGNPWELGTLKTDAGSILFPFKINGGGTKPTEFDILKLTNNQLVLVYGGNGAWGEATYWRFKKK